MCMECNALFLPFIVKRDNLVEAVFTKYTLLPVLNCLLVLIFASQMNNLDIEFNFITISSLSHASDFVH